MDFWILAITEAQSCENSIFLVPVKNKLVCCTPKCIGFSWLHDTVMCVLIKELYDRSNIETMSLLLTQMICRPRQQSGSDPDVTQFN